MDLIAFVLNTMIAAMLIGGTVVFFAQQDAPSASLSSAVSKKPSLSPSASPTPGPCPQPSSTCAGPSYSPPTPSP